MYIHIPHGSLKRTLLRDASSMGITSLFDETEKPAEIGKSWRTTM